MMWDLIGSKENREEGNIGKESVLLLESDPKICVRLCEILEQNGYEVETVFSEKEAGERLGSKLYNLFVYEPETVDGKLIQKVRLHTDIPILMLFSRECESMPIDHLRFGADDYMGCPLDEKKFLILADTIMRRNDPFYRKERKILRFQDISMDLSAGRVLVHGYEAKLTDTEKRLLELFLTHPQKMFTLENLSESIWNGERENNGYSIQAPVRGLRRKLRALNPAREYIVTEKGQGFHWEML